MGGEIQPSPSKPLTKHGFFTVPPPCPVVPSLPPYKRKGLVSVPLRVTQALHVELRLAGTLKSSSSGVPPCCTSLPDTDKGDKGGYAGDWDLLLILSCSVFRISMKLTQQIIHSAGTSGIGFNFHQLYVLGVKWPPKHGWIQELVGREVSDEVWNLVLSLKGKRRGERREILSKTPFRKEIFSRKSDLKARVQELEEAINHMRNDLLENLCCEPEKSPDKDLKYCDDCIVKLNIIAVADQVLP